jgi:hypothetical protein
MSSGRRVNYLVSKRGKRIPGRLGRRAGNRRSERMRASTVLSHRPQIFDRGRLVDVLFSERRDMAAAFHAHRSLGLLGSEAAGS